MGLLVLLPGVAAAEEGVGSDAERSIRLPGNLGLTGFMDMVDGRTPGLLDIRSGARYHGQIRDRSFDDGTINLSSREERHEFNVYLGVSFLGFIDVSARLPYLHRKDEFNRKGFPDIEADWERGLSGIDLAGKITLKLGPFDVAPYLYGRLPSGKRSVRDLAEFDYGSAVTFSLLNHYFALHANVSGVQIEKGTSALRYRLGTSFVVWSSDDYLLRIFAYGDGIEYEGSGDSDIDVDVGAQGVLFGNLTVEIGVSLRVIDGGHIDDDLKRDLRNLGTGNQSQFIDKHFEDQGTWSIQVGVGTIF